jgi:hypothetical protein
MYSLGKSNGNSGTQVPSNHLNDSLSVLDSSAEASNQKSPGKKNNAPTASGVVPESPAFAEGTGSGIGAQSKLLKEHIVNEKESPKTKSMVKSPAAKSTAPKEENEISRILTTPTASPQKPSKGASPKKLLARVTPNRNNTTPNTKMLLKMRNLIKHSQGPSPDQMRELSSEFENLTSTDVLQQRLPQFPEITEWLSESDTSATDTSSVSASAESTAAPPASPASNLSFVLATPSPAAVQAETPGPLPLQFSSPITPNFAPPVGESEILKADKDSLSQDGATDTDGSNQAKIKRLNNLRKKITEELEITKKNNQELFSENAMLMEKMQEFENKLTKNKTEIQEATEAFKQAKSESENQKIQFEKNDRKHHLERQEFLRNKNELLHKIAMLEQEKEAQKIKHESTVETLNSEKMTLKLQSDSLEALVKKTKELLKSSEAELRDSKTKIEKEKSKNVSLIDHNEQFKQQLAEATRINDALKASLALNKSKQATIAKSIEHEITSEQTGDKPKSTSQQQGEIQTLTAQMIMLKQQHADEIAELKRKIAGLTQQNLAVSLQSSGLNATVNQNTHATTPLTQTALKLEVAKLEQESQVATKTAVEAPVAGHSQVMMNEDLERRAQLQSRIQAIAYVSAKIIATQLEVEKQSVPDKQQVPTDIFALSATFPKLQSEGQCLSSQAKPKL